MRSEKVSSKTVREARKATQAAGRAARSTTGKAAASVAASVAGKVATRMAGKTGQAMLVAEGKRSLKAKAHTVAKVTRKAVKTGLIAGGIVAVAVVRHEMKVRRKLAQ